MNLNLHINIVSKITVVICQLINIGQYSVYISAINLGYFYFIISCSYFINSIAFIPLDYYIQANLINFIKRDGSLHRIILINKIFFKYILFGSILIALIGYVLFYEFIEYIIYGIILSIVIYANQNLKNTANNIGKSNVVSLSIVIESALKVLIFCILVKYSTEVASIIYSWILSYLMSIIYIIYIFNKENIYKKNKKIYENIEMKDIFEKVKPLSFSTTLNWIQSQGYRIIMVPLGYSEIVGIFSLVSGIGANAMNLINSIYSQQYSPKLYSSDGKYLKTYIRSGVYLILICLAGSTLVGKIFIELVTHGKYTGEWFILVYGLAIESAYLLIGAYVINLTLTDSIRRVYKVSVYGLTTCVTLFAMLYYLEIINLWTIGLPLIISNWLVAAFMFYEEKLQVEKM